MYKERVIQRERDHLVLLTLMHNSRIAADTLYTTHGRATYYSKKAFNTDFRCKSHGGKRRGTFEDYELPVVKNIMLSFLEENPTTDREGLRQHLIVIFDRPISLSSLSRLTKSFCWSWKVPTIFQLAKYRMDNVLLYLHYLTEIKQKEFHSLKFCDEAHIVSKDLGSRRVLGLKSQRVYLREKTLHCPRASITILTSVAGIPLFLDYRENTNDQFNFADFVLSCVANNHFKPGDFLVADNAAVHHGSDTFEIVTMALETVGARLIFLPAYSPELNPCELVFSHIKTYIRQKTRSDISPWARILLAASLVTPELLTKFYRHCIFPKNILPEL
eukprot:TRINITY_DN421_c0_g1_i14.p1 TRINITY_DN421_c0_g1~~TRINITY_DN421_c0_g1_i14.p1  ORF type:complete len:331 (+),score=44.83 TRINITY_DN421_c0_g1_i14:465-1457(+)